MDSSTYIIPTASETEIPRPSNATLIAINKYTGQCLGLVLTARDARRRAIPNWMHASAHEYIIWDGQYILVEDPVKLTFDWFLE